MRRRLLMMRRPRPVPGAGAIWDCTKAYGTTLPDLSGNGNHGTFGAGAAAPTITATGLGFDGGDYVRCGTAADGSASGLSIVAVAIKTAGTIVSKMTGTNATGKLGWDIVHDGPGAYKGSVYNGAGARCDALATDPRGNVWNCVTLVADGSTATLYIGTTAGTPVACTGLSLAPAQQATIGDLSYNLGGLGLVGGTLEIRVYPFALTPAQIAQNYTYLKAKFAPFGVPLS